MMKSTLSLVLVFFLIQLAPGQGYNSTWDGASHLFPDQVCPQWTFENFGSGTVQTFIGDSLRIISDNNQTDVYYMNTTLPAVGDTLTIEFKLRYVSGTFANNRTPCAVFWSMDSIGGYFWIGQDMIYDWSGFNVIGTTSNTDTDDSLHTYLIRIASDGSYYVFQEGSLMLSGSSFFDPYFVGSNQIIWGKLAGGVSGESRWLSLRHNSSGLTGIPAASSAFDSDAEYWTLDGTSQFNWQSTGGNPGGFLHLLDTAPDGAYIRAPGKYLGDWSSLDGKGILCWDHKLFQLGPDPVFVPFQVYIGGPGGQARFVLNRDPQFEWTTICAPIQQSSWIVDAGDWNSILTCVSSVKISIEMVENKAQPGDENGIDNVRLYLSANGDANGDATVDISDAVYLISYIFSGGSAPAPLLAGDANCDSTVDISDAVYLLSLR